MQMKKIGLVVLSFMFILVLLNLAPQVDTTTIDTKIDLQHEVALSNTIELPPPSMIAYWELNENGGTTVSDSMAPYITGTTFGNPTWIPGVAGSGLRLSGSQFIDFGRPSYLYLPEVLSLEAWVNLPDTSGLHTIIMNAYNSINIQYYFGIQNGHLYFDRQAGSPGNYVASSGIITPGQWHHVVVVMHWGMRSVWFYIDGAEELVYPYNDAYTGPSGEVTVGADRATGAPSFLNGMIDEIAVYNDILDPTIIQEHYLKGKLGLGYFDDLPPNTPPVAVDDAYTMPQDSTLYLSAPGVLENDVDADGDSLQVVLFSNPARGVLDLSSDGSLRYTPPPGFVGVDTFEYRAFDGRDYSSPAEVAITVEFVNKPPVAVDDFYATYEDQSLAVPAPGILINDHDDQPSNTLSVELVNNVAHGILSLSADGSFDYTPFSDWNGVDTFSYRVFDGSLYGNIAQVVITVYPVNDPPIAYDDAYSGLEDQILLGSSVLSNDLDIDGDVLQAILVSGPSHGTLEIYPDGSFSYTPDSDWFGEDFFTYRASDGVASSDIAIVTILIESVNDVPIVNDDAFTGLEDTALSGNVLSNDFDVEWDNCIVFLVSEPEHGTITLDSATGAFTYLPDADWFGMDSFTYNVYDGYVFSDVASVVLSILSVNDAPIAYDTTFVGNEDVILYATLPSGFDVDGDSLEYIVTTNPVHGTLVLDSASGSFSYTPDADWFGFDSFEYLVNDSILSSNIATVTIQILQDDDITGPVITILYTGDATDGNPGYWEVLVEDPESGISSILVEIDGVYAGASIGTYPVPNSLGNHVITVTAVNADTNNGANDQESSTLSDTVTILDDDVTAPIIEITYFGHMTDTNPGFWTVVVSDSESGIYSILVEIDGIAVGTTEGDFAVPSTLGFHSITVTAVNNDQDRPDDQETSSRSDVVLIEEGSLQTELTYLGDLEGVYSDSVCFEALLIDTSSGQPLEGKIIHFSLGSQSVTALTNADGLASICIILDQGAGMYELTVSYAGDDEYLPSELVNEFVLNKEVASVVYSGVTIKEVSDDEFTLQASIFDDTDGNWGNLSLAYLTFSIYLSSDPLKPIYVTVPVRVQPTDMAGIGVASWQIPSLPEGEYLIVACLLLDQNRFYYSSVTDPVTITIYEPERAQAHGAGKILDGDGYRAFFAFSAKYTCRGKLIGFLLYSYVDGDSVYLLRSFDILSFTTDGNHGYFEANATLSKLNFRTHHCSTEWYRARVDVFDNKKNRERDIFQIRIYNSLGLIKEEAGYDPVGHVSHGCIVVKHVKRH